MNKKNIISTIDDNQFKQFIIENSTDVFWILDRDRNTQYISNSIYELTGYTSQEFVLLSPEVKFTPGTNERLDIFFNNISDLKEFKELFVEYYTKDGTIVYTEVSGIILRDEDNNFNGVYGLSKNINDKYRLQNELSAEKEKNSEAEKFKSILLGIVGHEFRTPLSGILGLTKLLAQSLDKPDEQEILGYIYQSAQRLNATLNSVVTLAALETNQLDTKGEQIEINEVAQSIYQSFEPIIKNKNITFETMVLSNELVTYDENCLFQILYHLIDNAVKFTEKGKVNLGMALNTNGIGKYIEIKVQDTGIGIKKHKFNTIFEPFRQLSEGLNREFEGLGIGLTTTKKLVEKLNGSITVESRLNQGSLFTVKLPLENAPF